jgi:hypothetical protein
MSRPAKKLPTDWQGRGRPNKAQKEFIKQVRAMPMKKPKK